MPHVSIGPLPRKFGCSPVGSKGAAKYLMGLNGGPLDGCYVWVQPMVGPLPMSLKGEVGEYKEDKNLSLSWVAILPK